MASGIYCILNTVNGKCYIGQAKSFNKRWWYHRNGLNKGKHHCRHLQAAWNKYGGASFEFQILEETSVELLTESEQHWMDYFRFIGSVLYNTAKAAGTTRGMKRSPEVAALHFGKKVSQHTRALISASHCGLKQSPETVAKRKATMQERGYCVKGARRHTKNGVFHHSKEALGKMAAANKGKKLSPETIAKRQATRAERGCPPPPSAKGRKRSPESIAKGLEARRRNKLLKETPHLVPTRD